MMFERGVIEEVRTTGITSPTASQMIGLREIRELLVGKNRSHNASPKFNRPPGVTLKGS